MAADKDRARASVNKISTAIVTIVTTDAADAISAGVAGSAAVVGKAAAEDSSSSSSRDHAEIRRSAHRSLQ